MRTSAPTHETGSLFVGADVHRPAIMAQLPWLYPGRRCDSSVPVHQILHTPGPVARRRGGPATLGPPPKPSVAGSVGGGGARERHDGCPYLGVRNRADFATTMPAGRDCPTIRKASPVNGGLGVRDYEHPPLARCSSERNPQSLFGSFLVTQKGTRPAGRNPPTPEKCCKNHSLPRRNE